MGRLDLFIVAYTAALGMYVLYGPQPFLSSLRAEFGVDSPMASLVITTSLLPLGLAPVVYGYLLEYFSAKKLLVVSVGVLCILQFALPFQHDFTSILGLRFFQGLAFPALLTALMTYLAATNRPDKVQRVMSLYIGATIGGGFGGRILAGFLAAHFGWRTAMLCVGFGLTVNLIMLIPLKSDSSSSFSRIKLDAVKDVLQVSTFKQIYLIVFCIFFVFAAVFNMVPFRMTDLSDGISEFGIGLMYMGQGIGIAVSLMSGCITRTLGAPPGVFFKALAFYLGAVLVFLIPSVTVVFLNMFLFSAGMFLIHTAAPGYLNSMWRKNTGVVNGTYLMAYYLGGTVGSYLPAMVYRRWGWGVCILFLALIVCVALAAAWNLRRVDYEVVGLGPMS